MKLCDMTQAYNQTSGGIRTYIERKRAWLLEHTDYEHVLVVPGDHDDFERRGRVTCYTIQSPFIPGCEPYRVVLNLEKIQTILSFERPDIIELGSAYTLPWAAFRHRKQHDCRIAGFYHTDFPVSYAQRFVSMHLGRTSSLAARRIAAEYARMVYRRCDMTLAPSRLMSKRLKQYGVTDVRFLPLGVDTDHFHPARRRAAIRTELGVTPGELLLIYVGRLDIEKRPDIIADAVSLLPEDLHVRLALVGDGPLKSQLGASNAARRLIMIPYSTDKTYLAGLLASADIYVTAGAFETFGLSVVEAQASGLPVVGVRAGALPERVNRNTGMLCRPDSPGDMARCIESLARSDFRSRGQTARRLVEKQYSWDYTFERMFQLYRLLIGMDSAA